MKRRHFVAEVKSGGQTLAMVERFAWNAAVRASEALVRDYARDAGEMFTGAPPSVYGPVGQLGSTYRRTWTGDRTGTTLTVEMAEVAS